MESQPAKQDATGSPKSAEKPWGDEERLDHLCQNLHVKAKTKDSPLRKDFIDSWYWQMRNAVRLSDDFKNWYYASVTATAAAAATVPTLIAFTGTTDAFISTILRIVAAVLGVFVAGTATLLGVVEVGNRWRLYRFFAQSLEEAGWDYLKDNREDDKDDNAYHDFVAAIDNSRKWFGRAYLNQVAVLGHGQRKGHEGA
jgi:hypothetical protein